MEKWIQLIPLPTIRLRLRVAMEYYLRKGEPELQLLRDLANDCDISIDVGANTGVFTFLLSQTSRTVMAFEPVPQRYEELCKALPPNCDIFSLALSDRHGNSILRIPKIDGRLRFSLASISKRNTFSGSGKLERVLHLDSKMSTLDEVLSYTPYKGRKVDFIKIDVEGNEHEVLIGAKKTIHKHCPTVLLETEFRHAAPVADIFHFFYEFGYNARSLVQGQLVQINAEMLETLQSPAALAEKTINSSSGAYVNNIVFCKLTGG